jgi:hypothetical protein
MVTVINSQNFYEALKVFTQISEKITVCTAESFDNAVQCKDAQKAKNIVYIWCTEKNISRLKGESNILYIGQTKQSFAQRYAKYGTKWLGTKANALKFSHVIEKYGAITIFTCDFSKFGETLLLAEGQLLWWYFQNHCEFPPFNYTQTKIRNSEVVVELY